MSLQDLDEARRMHREGRVREALEIYRGITASDDATAEHWQLQAMAEQQAGDLTAARASIGRSIELDASQPAAQLVAGHIASELGEVAEAETRYRRAVELRPDWAAGWTSLGTLLQVEGRPLEALPALQRAVALDGKAVRAWNALGLAQLGLERFDDALRAFNFAISIDGRYAKPHIHVARILELRGDHERALASAMQAVRLDARDVEAQMVLGDMYRKRKAMESAEAALVAALRAQPGHAGAGQALADVYWEMGATDAARQAYAAVSTRHPGNLRAALGANLILPAVYGDRAEVEAAREGYAKGLERLESAALRFRYPDAARTLEDIRWTNFYLAYQGGDDRVLQSRYGDLVHGILERNAPEWIAPRTPRRNGPRRLRVGFASFFFYNSTVGRYFASWMTGLDRERFESFVYYTNAWMGDDSKAIAASVDRFRHLPARPLHVLAQEIAADELDVLVYPELGMNPDIFGLASLRLAPVQIAGWGHPTTTGLPTIDHFVSCAEMEPADAQASYRERLSLLPGLGTRYALPEGPTNIARSDLGLPDDATLYLVPQSLFKIHPDNDAILAGILERDPRGKIVAFASGHPRVVGRFAARLEARLREINVPLGQRVLFLPFLDHDAYLALNRVCDVMIDTLHWSGGNTSLDALANGLPVVTLPGGLMRGRQSQAMLRALGVPELVASDAEGFVAKAAEVGRNPDLRHDLSRRILAARAELFDREEPVRAFNDFLERAARAEPGAPRP